MATAADELLNDFASSGDEAEEDIDDSTVAQLIDEADGHGYGDADGSIGVDAMEVDGGGEVFQEVRQANGTTVDKLHELEDAEATKARVEKMQLRAVKDVRSVAGLMQTLEPVMQRISQFQQQGPAQSVVVGNIEDHPEYGLLTQSNSLSTMIDGEVALVHKFIRDHYSTRFPELERLVTTPLEYAKVVTIIGNGPMTSDSIKALQTSTDNLLGMGLKAFLDGPSLMIVTVEATTSKGEEMSDEELKRVQQACAMAIALHKAKNFLTDYVQSRMTVFAPNLTALIGSLTAAQLLNAAGGLMGLSKTPACNIPSWGSKKRRAGLATNVGIRQQGYLYHSDMIQHITSDLKKQAMRIVAAKLVLAARVDRIHSSPDGATGEELKAACLERLEKLTEPPPNKGHRALPAPDDKPSRKRGGRRARKAKEALAMTELRQAQNRMAFGKEEKEVGYGTGEGTAGLGMIGQQGEGKIRALQVDSRTRAKVGSKNKGWGTASTNMGEAERSADMDLRGQGLRTRGVASSATGGTGAATVGTTSSLTFTPMQGLQLVDPKMQAELGRKRKADEDRWFKGGSFTQIGGGDGGVPGASGGFQVPDLPASKRVDTGANKKTTMGPPMTRKQ